MIFGDDQHSPCVLVPSAVVCRGEDSYEVASGEPLESVQDAFVGSYDFQQFIILKESPHNIRAELNNVSSAMRVSDDIHLNAQVVIVLCWVRPENINNQFLHGSLHLVNNLQWPRNLLDLL